MFALHIRDAYISFLHTHANTNLQSIIITNLILRKWNDRYRHCYRLHVAFLQPVLISSQNKENGTVIRIQIELRPWFPTWKRRSWFPMWKRRSWFPTWKRRSWSPLWKRRSWSPHLKLPGFSDLCSRNLFEKDPNFAHFQPNRHSASCHNTRNSSPKWVP